MALSDTEKASIRRYLGFPDSNRQLHMNTRIEGALDALSPEGEVEVRVQLVDLAAIETTLRGSWGRQKVLKAEEVTLAGDGEIRALRAEGNRITGMLADILGVTARRSVFTSGSRSGAASRG